MWWFRKPVAALLGRESFKLGVGKDLFTLSVDKAGALQEKTVPAQTGLVVSETVKETVVAQDAAVVSEGQKALAAVRHAGVSPVVREYTNPIQTDLQKFQLRPEEQIELLVRGLALAKAYFNAEQTYRVIFGSQIAVLKRLPCRDCTGPSRLP